nr:PREDICTED: ubiquitin carboxyl-terminal hydrolase 16 [Tribolium castaneum]XP_015838143.1 PREDICTED: ubiquitin carboxyl-terminal hydrolase 16 [Tribolium castaneum]XP_015838144.1 PREDICTED: ubiquitin carboxyl-terminal hydrolase 16 [Tribolium castaneum]|eukprot:XP_015838142.1 PREDICTED: ubiquitin carboxyl-terminal hydrolase 16 [Tribolium castaneum]
MTDCRHVRQAVDLQKVKKALIKTGLTTECEQCKKMPKVASEMEPEFEFDNSLWLCLRCGNQACGRNKNMHALEHFKTPHSDSHAICVDTTNWSVWCYDCDEVVNATCKKKLLEAVEYLQKLAEGKSNALPKPAEHQVMDLVPVTSSMSFGNMFNFTASNVPRPRGLMNLGNTCFFNSVVQCLAQTPYLLNLLQETSEPGQFFQLPGGKLNPQDSDSPVLEPLTGELEKWRPLMATLAETIVEVNNGRSEAYVPRLLLSKLTARMPQFGGGNQHDSHELLRHLLEAVREEDLRRYQSVILDRLGLNTKTDPSTVEGEKKKIIKFYGQQASDLLLPTEQVFRGVLVSTLQCQECQHTSHRDEFFLDLSLPITEKQLPPVLRRKAEEIEDNKPSRHQIKKEKRAERKKNKKQKSHKNVNIVMGPSNQPTAGLDVDMDKSDSESDADVEDNVEVSEEVTKGMESGYNSDKVDNSSPDSNNRGISPEMRIDDSGVPSPAIGMLSASHGTPDNSPASSETNIDMGSPLIDHCSPEEDGNEYFDRPESRLAFVNNKNVDLKTGLSKLSLLNDGDSSKVGTFCNDKMDDDDNFEGACGGEDPKDEKMDEDDEDVDLWTNTMSARYQCEEGEYSVQSCLNQFTACELMTGNNKVSCELCTKRHGGPDKKTVYTNATKQLLIYNPPAVLILHLKRFQVYRFRSAKVPKFVKFPTLLDLAPFCSKRSQNLPTFEAGQTKVLYSLYGVVEHSGSIHGGHYVAYVKVRPKLEENSYRWQFLPKNQKNEKGQAPKGAQGEPEVPSGKWYYISDSHVSEASETRVLSAQAYLLFYERIL